MLHREDWIDLARGLDWELSWATEEDVFPTAISGEPALPRAAWVSWEEPFRTSFREYVEMQAEKEAGVRAVREAVGRLSDAQALDFSWLNGVKLHSAMLPLAEFAAVVGNLRAARFGRTSAWRNAALLGALDECRHAQIPLLVMHDLVKWDRQFDWTHRLLHTNCWVAIAGRHLVDEMLLLADPIEFAIATNFVFETGFTNLQFVGLTALSDQVGDHLFRSMLTSIQTDEARHAQIGPPVLAVIAQHDPARAQRLLDKWFWRSWHLFAIVTGFAIDYLSPVDKRAFSFKEFMHEWVIGQYRGSLREFGLKEPWYWDEFVRSLDHYHHMVYASAYTYRATVWFDFALPGPDERQWLAEKYPASWHQYDGIWQRIAERWQATDPGVDFGVHGTSIVGFCHLCQIVLCCGTPERNDAVAIEHDGKPYIFCSEPCRWIFEQEPERYAGHRDLVKRVLAGEAPGNLVEMLTQYCGLTYETWGKDARAGSYPWMKRPPTPRRPGAGA